MSRECEVCGKEAATCECVSWTFLLKDISESLSVIADALRSVRNCYEELNARLSKLEKEK